MISDDAINFSSLSCHAFYFNLVFPGRQENDGGMRIDALLSRYGYCSRREALRWIKKARVTILGKPADSPSQKAEPEDVLVDGESIEFPRGIYIAFYKPLGVTCSREERDGTPIYDLLPPVWSLRNPPVTSVGRLDKDTEGLLLITDDGQFVHKLTSPKHHVGKVYELTTDEDIPETAAANFASGSFMLEGERSPCQPAQLELLGARHARMTLTEGRYHQVRRMLAAVGAPVETLKRISIGPLELQNLQLEPGDWTPIDPALFGK